MNTVRFHVYIQVVLREIPLGMIGIYVYGAFYLMDASPVGECIDRVQETWK